MSCHESKQNPSNSNLVMCVMFRILCRPNSVMQDETHSLFVLRDLLSGPFCEEFEKKILNSDRRKKKEIRHEININYKRSGRHNLLL